MDHRTPSYDDAYSRTLAGRMEAVAKAWSATIARAFGPRNQEGPEG